MYTMDLTEEQLTETISRRTFKGPMKNQVELMNRLFKDEYSIIRSGPEVEDYKCTGRFHIVVEKVLTRSDRE